jgi:hypothetical protein
MICVWCFCRLVEGGVRWPPRRSTRRFDSNDFHLALSRELSARSRGSIWRESDLVDHSS